MVVQCCASQYTVLTIMMFLLLVLGIPIGPDVHVAFGCNCEYITTITHTSHIFLISSLIPCYLQVILAICLRRELDSGLLGLAFVYMNSLSGLFQFMVRQ